MLVVSSCTKAKAVRNHPDELNLEDFRDQVRLRRLEQALESFKRPAGEMYTGNQHKRLMEGVGLLRRAFGNEVVDVKIISAGYGLIDEQQLIAPYNATFDSLSRSDARGWARQLRIADEVRSAIRGYPLVVVLLGVNYLRPIEPPVRPDTNQRLVFFAHDSREYDLKAPGVVIVPPERKYPGNQIGRKGFMFELFARALVREGRSLWHEILKDQTPTTITAALDGV